MKVVRIADPDQVRPSHVVLLCLVVVTLAGSCLLTSGPHQDILHDGAVEWGPDSLLRAVVEVLNLQFSQTTTKGVAIKGLVFGMGSALAMLTLGFVLGVKPRRGDEASAADITLVEEAAAEDGPAAAVPWKKKDVPLLAAAQLMMLAVGLWSLASIAWSNAPDYARGGAILLGIQLMWALAVGLGLNRVAARWAAYGLVIVCTATAVLALAYHRERNPTLRASYPIGNPLALAACLIPGIVVAGGALVACVAPLKRRRSAGQVVAVIACVIAIAVMLYAFHLTRSRGPLIGLLVGFGAMVFLAGRGRTRLVVGLAMVVGLAGAGWYFLGQRVAHSPTGRDASLRVRLYTWSYAFDLAVESPLVGHGQGGFVLAGDAKASGEDALGDPLALNARIAHAHSEWLETWCDLGSVGLVLVVGGLFLTFWAGMDALPHMPTAAMRWLLISLLAALAALVAEEATNVALRLPGLPAVYFTVIGLIWAMSARSGPGWMDRLKSGPPGRVGSFVVAAALATGAMAMTVRDFRGARALYDVAGALQGLEWEQTLTLAELARNDRLNPQDRLVACNAVCATHLHVARKHQLESFRQAEQAHAADPPDDRLLALADQNRRRSVEYVQAGLSELGELLRKSPASWNSGVWEYGFYMVLAEFDRAALNTTGLEANLAAASAALEREMARRPFDPGLAVRYADAQGQQVDLATLLDVLARPLRHNATPPAYIELLGNLASSPAFDEAFAPIHARLAGVAPELPVEQWTDPWAPEKLRLWAAILFTRNVHAAAEEELTRAAALYDVIRESAPLGAASCYAELGDARYFARMDDPTAAMEAARRAIELAPNSEQGRALAGVVRDRIITYELAAGNEETARELLRQSAAQASERRLDADLGARYSRMAHGGARRDPARLSRGFARWVERALELNPAYEMGWEEAESVHMLGRALQMGADMRVVLPFVDRVATLRPESTAFHELRAQLRAALGLPDEPAAASQPADPPGAASQPTPGPERQAG